MAYITLDTLYTVFFYIINIIVDLLLAYFLILSSSCFLMWRWTVDNEFLPPAAVTGNSLCAFRSHCLQIFIEGGPPSLLSTSLLLFARNTGSQFMATFTGLSIPIPLSWSMKLCIKPVIVYGYVITSVVQYTVLKIVSLSWQYKIVSYLVSSRYFWKVSWQWGRYFLKILFTIYFVYIV